MGMYYHFDTYAHQREELAVSDSIPQLTSHHLLAHSRNPTTIPLRCYCTSLSETDLDLMLMLSVMTNIRRAVRSRQSRTKGKMSLSMLDGSRGCQRGKGSKRDVECFNCHKKGHKRPLLAKGEERKGKARS